MAIERSEPQAAARPSFLLSTYRTGSTLLRLLLDTHSEIWCPDEIMTGPLMSWLLNVVEAGIESPIELTHTRLRFEEDAQLDPRAVAETRDVLDSMMTRYTRTRGKRGWCDKSPHNTRYIRVIPKVFPDARYLCLHRHCLDVVQSGLGTYQQGFEPVEFAEWAARYPTNFVEALSLAWCEATEALLRHEARFPDRTMRLRYEDLTSEPEATTESVVEFLGYKHEPDLVARVFSSPHYQRTEGGDAGALLSTRIMKDRLGTGRKLNWNRALSPDTLQKVNRLLADIGYPTLDPRSVHYEVSVSSPAGGSAGQDTGATHAAESGDDAPTQRIRELFERRIAARLRAAPEAAALVEGTFAFQVTGRGGGEWTVAPSNVETPVTVGGNAETRIRLSADHVMDLFEGSLNPYIALREGLLAVEGEVRLQHVRGLIGLLVPLDDR
jgi:protein-tyrosine sulfotransferase